MTEDLSGLLPTVPLATEPLRLLEAAFVTGAAGDVVSSGQKKRGGHPIGVTRTQSEPEAQTTRGVPAGFETEQSEQL
jgi:hypothetical protein